MVTFTVSARGKPIDMPMPIFLNRSYYEVLGKIDSIFGFMRFSHFYGGRSFISQQISRQDLFWMYDNNIGLRLPLSNHNFDYKVYRSELQFFRDFHRAGNIIICANDSLANAIRTDFPLFKIEASVINCITTQDDITNSLVLYDSIILPMSYSSSPELLVNLTPKDRIVLFGNAGCAYNCPNKLCYKYISDSIFFGKASGYNCSQSINIRPKLGFIEFDLDRLIAIGYSRFKLLRKIPTGTTGY